MNYQELKNAIIEVIRTNGNEEITGEVLQFVLLEMVSSLGKDFQFAGVATPQTEIIERDDKVAWVLGAGTYENFGIPFTVAVDEIAFVLYNGTYRVQKVKTGVIVDDTLTSEGQNPVKGGAIYAEFEKLRAAGYLFAGVATPSLVPPASLTEKIFYLATQGGAYPNLDNITLTKGINIIRFDGTSWLGESLIAITDEVIDSNVSLITAAGVYSGLSGKVDKVEGMGLSQNSYTNTEKSKLGGLPTAQELAQMLLGKQDVLTFDTTPTLNSQNPVTSDGIQRAIEAILVLIPSAASALNQLADKSFVNSTAATASATFRGTYNLVSDLSLAVTATHAQIAEALTGAVSGEDNNDYAFVQIPTSADTPTEIRVTERYKFNGTAWSYEYDLNNSGFTAAQWEAINSAITSALVTKLSNLPNATELATLFAGKQNTLTFDNAPVSGSDNPVKSGGIYDAIAAIAAVIPSTATSSNKLIDENALTAYVGGIIGALDASFDLTSTDGHVTLKMTQVDGVITTLQILTSDIASAQALTTLSGQVSTNADDIAALQALYNALQQSDPIVIEPTDTWPVSNPSTHDIYRVVDRVNTPPQYYSDYMFKADDLTTPVLMATYNNAIDQRPKKASTNLVTSGGVFDNMGALDVSELNATENPTHTLAEYATLDAALADIPSDYQKGGMSVKFVQSSSQNSDNKYVQYRLMSDSWSTDTEDWAVADEGVYAENPEFIYVKTDKDGEILWAIKIDGGIYYGAGCPQQVKDYVMKYYQDNIIPLINGKVDKVVGKSLSSNDFTDGDKTVVRINELIDNPEFLFAITDSKGQILESLLPNSDKYFYGNVFKRGKELITIDEVPNVISSSFGFIDKRTATYDNTSGSTNPSFYLKTYEESFKAGDTIAVDLKSDTWQGIEWVMLYDVTNSQQLYLWQGAAKKDGSYYITLLADTNAIAVRYRVNAGYAINLTSVFSTKIWVCSEEIMDDKIERKVGEAGEIDLRGLQVNGDPEDGHVIVGIDSQGATKPYSVAVGYSNMTNNSGQKNVAIGVQNLRSNAGTGNVAIGYHSLFRNTNAGNNTGVGGESLDDNLSGNDNTAVGGYALQRNNLGSYNVAIGSYALNGNSPDTQGPGSGYDAGGHVVNVSKSVAIGYKALHNSSNGTTGDGSTGDHDNIAIGYEASVNLRGKSNTIAIGSGVEPTKSNQVIIGNSTVEEIVFGNKKIVFNLDGSVSWLSIN